MPIPAGQNCGNCQYWDTDSGSPGPGTEGQCRYTYPEFTTPNWVNVLYEDWCSRWMPAGTGTSGLQPFDSAIGYRGNDATGTTAAMDNTWTLLTPTWAATVNARNFVLDSAGVIKLNITEGTPSPTTRLFVNFNGIVSFKSGSANEDIELTIGQNGTPLEDYRVPLHFRSAGDAGPIPVVGALEGADQDTWSLYARSPTINDVTYISYHLLLLSTLVLVL